MTREIALIDAAMTVQIWQRGLRVQHVRCPGYTAERIKRHVARALHCYPTWPAIEDSIVRRLMAEAEVQDVPMRRAA